jgi:hypothetical protein
MPLNAFATHRPSGRAYHERNPNSWLSMASGFRHGPDECDASTAGHWDSGSFALALSRRRCGAAPYMSSVAPRFTNMPLSPRPFGSRLVVRLGVFALNSGHLGWPFTQCVTWRTVSRHTAQAFQSPLAGAGHAGPPHDLRDSQVQTTHRPRSVWDRARHAHSVTLIHQSHRSSDTIRLAAKDLSDVCSLSGRGIPPLSTP